LKQGIYVTTYAGDADYNCNWLGGEVVAAEVMGQDWDRAGYVNITTSDGIIHGQVKQAGSFSFTRIYEIGHEVKSSPPFICLKAHRLSICIGTVLSTSGRTRTF
jgi:hypothetical protein